MADDKRFLGANDIAEILGCSASYAYNVIRQLNAEMKEKNYITKQIVKAQAVEHLQNRYSIPKKRYQIVSRKSKRCSERVTGQN